jgi:hypothetical protein
MAESTLDTAGTLPGCRHLAGIRPVRPHSSDCPPCRAAGTRWVDLWLCLSCGSVACSDDSPSRHARAHYEETDHPIWTNLRNDPGPLWCHVHRRYVGWSPP